MSAEGLLDQDAELVEFKVPGASDRTVIIATTGGGKTTASAWLLSLQRLDKRPWVILDYKFEELWDLVGSSYIRELKLGAMPGRTGIYIMHVLPGQEDDVEAWFWRVWRRGNIGILCDEVSLVPKGAAFKAILRQGRSKLIPVIACTQRPNGVDREVFTESQYKMILGLEDQRDMKIVQEYTRGLPRDLNLERYWSWWYDGKQRQSFLLQPVPNPHRLVRDLRQAAPRVGLW